MPDERAAPDDDAAVAAFKARISKLETEEGRMRGVNFRPLPTDIIVVTPPKCGTTWVCQVLFSLLSAGDLAGVDELNIEIPCLEMAADAGLDLDAPQRHAPPRAFKTHLHARWCPAGAGRYIFVARHPLDAGPSFYHFLAGWFFDAADISLETFLTQFWLARGYPHTPMVNSSMWHTLASWWPRRADADVLWLHYEDLEADLPAAVRLVADFTGVGAGDAARQAAAARQASLAEMLARPTLYDEHHLKRARNAACGLPPGAGLGPGSSGKVRRGGRGRAEMPPALAAAAEAKWREVVEPVCGYTSYDEMRAGVNRELGRPFA